jgi:hypothetical protein
MEEQMRTVVGLFDRFEDAQQVVRELNQAGFRGDEINLIARDANGEYTQSIDTDRVGRGEDVSDGAGAGAGIGAVLGGIAGFLVGLGALAIPGIGPVIAAGPIVGALGGAGIGAVSGGLIGALVDWGVPDEHANYYAEGVRRGGTLVAVRADDVRVDQALQIMNRYNPVDIERHAQQWRQEKWSGFDPNSDPLTSDRLQYNRRGTGTTTGGMMDRDRDFNRAHDRVEDHDAYRTSDQRERDLRDQGQGMMDHERDYQTRDRSNVPVTGDSAFDRDQDMTMDRDRDLGNLDRDSDFTTGRTTMESGGAMGGVMPDSDDEWGRYEPMYRQHYQSAYGTRGHNYDAYRPAYRFGYEMARNPRYRDYDWNRFEPEARREWDRMGTREQGTWEDIKDAVRHAWDSLRR